MRRNGDEFGPEYVVRGQNLEQLLDVISAHLGYAAKKFFTTDGQMVRDFATLDRDQCLWVSCGEAYVDPLVLKQQVGAVQSEIREAIVDFFFFFLFF